MKRRLASTAVLILFALIIVRAAPATGQTKIEQFVDSEYEYSFQYPSGWPIRKLPEGEADKDVRVLLQGPNGSSFTVVVEKPDKKTTKEEFQAGIHGKEVVEAMMRNTIEQVYKTISRNIKATSMTIGERRDLSNDSGVKFYIATLHAVANEKFIIVAGIHAFPFSKDYAVNFLMTSFKDKATKEELSALTFVFNSFRLSSEPSESETPSGPAARAPATVAPKP
ncbi:MAG TPA: hypothetical protein VMO00_10505 [Methylomirabilota bacterium]|nr:hypothetical protein [Methylomirabilota bacterium]